MLYLDVTSSCKSPMNTGVQRVVRGLYRSLAAMADVTPLVWDPALAAYCTLSRRERGYLENPFGDGRAVRSHPPRPGDAEPGRRANPVPLWSKLARSVVHRWNRVDLPARLTAADTLFVPEIFQDNRLEFLAMLRRRTAARRVAVCHDALPWSRPEMIPPARQAGFAAYLNALGDFDHVVTISRETADDLHACWRAHGRAAANTPPVSIFPWPVNHGGADRRIVPPPDADGAGRRAVVCVGTFEPRKNHLVLLEAAAQAWGRGADFELILIGRTTAQWGARVVGAMEELQAAGWPVRWLRHVDDATLRRAYDACAFTVFPSLAEGLGLPILESLWHGRPCVCGSNGGIGEAAAGGGCLAVDQTDPEALAAALESLLADREMYRRLCGEAAGREFGTWEEYARRLLPIFAPSPQSASA